MPRIISLSGLVLCACGGTVSTDTIYLGDGSSPAIRVVAELGLAPGDLSAGADGELLISLHPFYEPSRRMGVRPSGGAWRYPDAPGLDAPTGVELGADGTRWVLDSGARARRQPRLLAMREKRTTSWGLSAIRRTSFISDIVVDADRGLVYMADRANGGDAALVVLDTETGHDRRLLEGHMSVVPESLDLIMDGHPLEHVSPSGERVRPRIGVATLAMDPRGEWLYYGPTNARSLYRVRTRDLSDTTLDARELAKRVERFGDKPISGGLAVDHLGNVYVGDLARHAIGVISPDGAYSVLHQDARLRWVDAFSIAPDGSLYAAVNQLHRSSELNAGHNTARPPFLIVQFAALSP